MSTSRTSLDSTQMVDEIRQAAIKVEIAYDLLQSLIRKHVEGPKDGK